MIRTARRGERFAPAFAVPAAVVILVAGLSVTVYTLSTADAAALFTTAPQTDLPQQTEPPKQTDPPKQTEPPQSTDPVQPSGEVQSAGARIEGTAVLESKVGFPQRILQIVYPGGELEVRDVDPRTTPIVLRIDASYAHGTDFRYDLTWTGMEPGEFNLTEYLRRKDGTDSSGLPACLVKVQTVLAASAFDLKLEGPQPPVRSAPYRTAWLVGSIIWVAGLIVFIAIGRRRKVIMTAVTPEQIARAKLSRIEELITAAMQSEQFTTEQKAVLDRLILDFWRERRKLTDQTAEASLRILRQDPQAGPLLQQVERWLYDRPEKTSQEELVRVLAPLRAIVQQAAGEKSFHAGGQA